MADESPQSPRSDDASSPPEESPSREARDRDPPSGGPPAEDESETQSPRDSDADESDAVTGTGTETGPEATDDRRAAPAESADESTAEPTANAGADADSGSGEGSGPLGASSSTVAEHEPEQTEDVPADVRQYDRFKKIDGARYERVNEFLRDRTYITAREWAIARLCSDFRTETGSEMTKIGENLPELVPFMTDTYTPQAVNQARAAFEDKVRKAGATFLYGAMCDFFTADQLDEVMYEATEVAKFLLEVEGVDLAVEEELEAEDRISSVMRDVRHASESLRYEGVECPHCGEEIESVGAED